MDSSIQIVWTFIQLFVAGIACFTYAVAINAFPKSLTSFLKIELYVVLSSLIPIEMIVLKNRTICSGKIPDRPKS